MLKSWSLNLSVKKTSGLPIYLQIAQQIIDEIQKGRLKPSTAMPGTRELSVQLEVNRKTVVLAYDELIAQGWITTENRRGTFVSPSLPNFVSTNASAVIASNEFKTRVLVPYKDSDDFETMSTSKEIIDFNDGIPDTRLVPLKMLSKAFRHSLLFSAKNSKLGYDNPKGAHALRSAIAVMLNIERGLNVTVNNICVVRGSQMGIFLAARILTKPGDSVAFEKLSYPPAREAFKSCGASIVNVGQDEQGIDVNALRALCKKQSIRAVYVTPHHQFPTTTTMSAERRLNLLLLAKEFGFFIIEDDYDHEFHFSHHPVLPLASSEHSGKVIYVGSLSKVLAPGLRIGYVVASKEFIDQCASEVMLIDRQGSSVTELAVAELMNSGEIKRHIRKTLKIYNERRNVLISAIRDDLNDYVFFDKPNGGLAIWLKLNPNLDINLLVTKALNEGLRILPWSLFSETQINTNAIRLGFGNLNTNELIEGVRRLKKALIACND